ncbi:MAG: hypothetical protein AAF732_19215 [Pseudomonadota bacterium]
MKAVDTQTLGTLLLASGMVGAFLMPSLTVVLAPVAMPALFAVACFSFASLVDQSKAQLFPLDRTTWLVVGWQQVVLPSLVLAAAILLDIDKQTTSMMIVTACAGSLFASPMLAGLLDLDQKRALQTLVVSTAVMPVSLYVFELIAHNEHANLDLQSYISRAAIFLGIPLILLWIYIRISQNFSAASSRSLQVVFHWASLIALILFAIGIMQPVSQELSANPTKVVFYLFLAVFMTTIMYVLTAVVMYRFGPREAMTSAILAGLRNVGLALALLNDQLGSDLPLYVGVSMIPMCLAPVLLRLSSRLHDTAPAGQSYAQS